MSTRGHIAAIRFGYGLRLGEAPPADPMAWLEAQIAEPAPLVEGPGTADVIRLRAETLAARREQALAQRAAQQAGQPAGQAEPPPPAAAMPPAAPPPDPLAQLRQAESRAWAERRLATDAGFRERLVDFWMNHFTVSRRHGVAGVVVGPLEREAIRPNLTGSFAEMVVAVTRHPAMLVYLDNHLSIGPGSPVGQRSRRGLNENLAREVLELHTISPAGGYTQGDVQELARILTGWTVALNAEPHGFVWRGDTHEPGEKRLLGRTFAEGPGSQAAALRFIATREASYRHVAVRLCRHFVADNPPPEAVRSVTQALNRSRGELAAAYRALIALPDAWDPPLTKVRAPQDYVLAVFSGRFGRAEPAAVAEAALGPLARAETVDAMRGAGSVRDALTLLFGSPEFMHR
jgi:uncharacterized protein (DUF1800 family)